MFIRRIRPLAITLLTALTITGATAGAAVAASAQGQHSHARPAATRWCCTQQTQVAA